MPAIGLIIPDIKGVGYLTDSKGYYERQFSSTGTQHFYFHEVPDGVLRYVYLVSMTTNKGTDLIYGMRVLDKDNQVKLFMEYGRDLSWEYSKVYPRPFWMSPGEKLDFYFYVNDTTVIYKISVGSLDFKYSG